MIHPLGDLTVLNQYKAAPFIPGYPIDRRTFYSPVDNVHGALVAVVGSAVKSLVVAMYGFDDQDLANALKTKLLDPNIYVQLTLDSSQAGGIHEKTLLTGEEYPSSTVAVGRSEKGAIMHLKEIVIDGVVLVTGSTNWSTGGEDLQDNQLTISLDPYGSAEAMARIGAIHANMLSKQVTSGHTTSYKVSI